MKMGAKLHLIFNMKLKRLFPLLMVGALVSCNQNDFVKEDKVFCFDTVVDFKLYEGNDEDVSEIKTLLNYYDSISDNYKARAGVNNVYTINSSNEDVEVDARLYNLLKTSFDASTNYGANYFNPLCGSLAKKWKEALANKQILDEETIASELNKINTSSLTFKDNNVVQRTGEAEIDLGGIVKGYVLDEIGAYLSFRGISKYLINAGSSSILLGEKNEGDGYFKVGIDSKILANSYLKLKNCVVSTSSIAEQGVKITEEGPTYSHIINPIIGSAINTQDAVIVISSNASKGDALSTSLMMNTVEEIKAIEASQEIKCIVIKNKEVIYCNSSLEVLHR